MKVLFSLLTIICTLQVSVAQVTTKVLLKTTAGDIVIGLYDDTPNHKENFIKLVKDGYYNGLLFHRVMKGFMVQGGDPDSKDAETGTALGNGGPGYQIDAEFLPKYYHKKGALAAARQPDGVNPEKKSSGSQFYLVQGRTYTDEELAGFEMQQAQAAKNKLFQSMLQMPENAQLKAQIEAYSKVGNKKELDFIIQKITPTIEQEYQKLGLGYSDQAKKDYKELGGTPFLDGLYTVFGEILEGLEVVDTIAENEVDAKNRPLEDVKIIKAKILK
jgi:cyclophilin family peptidyl-prolyl cis-trans isomerase